MELSLPKPNESIKFQVTSKRGKTYYMRMRGTDPHGATLRFLCKEGETVWHNEIAVLKSNQFPTVGQGAYSVIEVTHEYTIMAYDDILFNITNGVIVGVRAWE